MRLGMLLVALLLTSGSSTPARGQNAGEPFTFVTVGQKVTVRKADGEVVRGRVTRADKEGILVDAGKKQGTLQVANSDIVKIGRRSRGKGALIGLGVAAGVGIAAGWMNPPLDFTRTEGGSVYGIFYGAIGAAVGAAVGVDKTIYRRR
jgi:hypothetical protein